MSRSEGHLVIKIKSCNASLSMLLVRIRNYLKSVPRYRFLILGTTHPDTLYILQEGREDPWLFFEAKRGLRAKKFGKHWSKLLIQPVNTIHDMMWSKPDLSSFDMSGAISANFGPHAGNLKSYIYIYIYIYIYKHSDIAAD